MTTFQDEVIEKKWDTKGIKGREHGGWSSWSSLSYLPFFFSPGADMPDEDRPHKPRKRFGADEDLLLAREVNAKLPYRAGYGEVMNAWAAVAAALEAIPAFSMASVTAKSCHSRFKALIEAHRRSNRESARASGVAEEVTELTCVLDDLVTDFDDFVEDEAAEKRQHKQSERTMENAGSVARTQATQRLSERGEPEAARNKTNKKTDDASLIKAIHEHTEKAAATQELLQQDMELRKLQFEAKMEILREERRLDREARAEEMKMARREREKERHEEREYRKEFMREMLQLQIKMSR